MRILLSALPPVVRVIVEEIANRLQVRSLVGIEVNTNTGFAVLLVERLIHDPMTPGILATVHVPLGDEERRAVLQGLRVDTSHAAV